MLDGTVHPDWSVTSRIKLLYRKVPLASDVDSDWNGPILMDKPQAVLIYAKDGS